jgi:hypothetical protein
MEWSDFKALAAKPEKWKVQNNFICEDPLMA